MRKLTHQRPIALLLCIVMVLSLIPVLPIAAFANDQYKVYAGTEPVESVAVPRTGTVTLRAEGSAEAAHQWQIQAGPDFWVDIQGENAETIDLRYAMVASLMTDGVAHLRCKSGEEVTDSIAVTLDNTAPEFNTPAFERPVVAEAPMAVDNYMEDLYAQAIELTDEIIPELEKAYEAAQAATAQAQAKVDALLAAAQETQAPTEVTEAPTEATEAPTEAPVQVEEMPTEATQAAEDLPAPQSLEETQAPETEATEATEAVDPTMELLSNDQPRFTVMLLSNDQPTDALAQAQAELETAKANEAAIKAQLDAANAKLDELTAQLASYSGGIMTLDENNANPEVPATYSVVIKYVFADGTTQAASPYTANVAAGSALNVTVSSPAVLGYEPYDKEGNPAPSITINETINENKTYIITYKPAVVNFTVKHYQQNLNDDNYTLAETETKTGYTESAVAGTQGTDGNWSNDLAKTYSGFYALLYDGSVKIAADGSTEVDIYYDRYYYLMNFDLDGGYGVEPIYARYGASISVGTPTRAGYNFSGWDKTIPATMPAENTTFKAQWTAGDKAKVTVVFWGENANDEEYSYDHTGTIEVTPGTEFTFTNNTQFLICQKEEHIHGTDCKMTCSHPTHDLSCYSVEQGWNTEYVLREANKPNQNMTDAGNGIYTYTTGSNWNSTTHYYLNIGDKWYAAYSRDTDWYGNVSYELSDSQEISFNCSHAHNASCWSCGKIEHAHSNSEGCFQTGAGMDSDKWKFVSSETVTVAADGTSVVNVYYDRVEYMVQFYNRPNRGNPTEYENLRITAKWGAQILDKWPTYDGSSTWYVKASADYYESDPCQNSIQIMPVGGTKFYGPYDGDGKYHAYYYVEVIPGESGETLNGVQYKLHHTDSSVFSGTVTDEERYEIEGFTFKEGTANGQSFNNAKFYYTRNSYNLEYMSSGSKLEDKTASVKYQEPLSKYNIEPPYPDNLEPNAYEFEGWYTDQYFHNKVDWTTDTMPASDVMVYAHWVPVTHTVTFALDKNAEPGLYPAQTVPHGSKITAVNTPTNGSYTFVGWFYDDNGVEKAFDPANMPVNRDLNLYGKWSANTLVPYTIKYAVENADGTLTYIAEDTTGSALALTTKTFEAKTGDELNAGYQSGYFPKEASHSITMSADEGATNEFTFIYVEKQKVPYTVRYLEKETNAVLHEEKRVETPDAIVTETFVAITGYMPDAYQKRLVLSADEELNVITFWYVKDDTHAPLHIVHYTQNIEGDGYTVYQESTDINALIGTQYSENPLTIPGFEYKAEKSTASGTMTAEGLELTLYYDRIQYPYEFKFLEQGTNKVLAESVTGNARYQAQVTQAAKTIPGYTLVSEANQAINIAIEDPANVADKNVRIFYYMENQVTIEYKVVGPDGQIDTAGNFGTATPASETIKVRTDTAGGSTAAPKDNTYKFVGWFKDEACTQSVGTDAHYTPAKTGDKDTNGVPQTYEAATYYAKFEYNLTSMTIEKKGTAYDSSDSFIFDIYHGGEKVTTVTMKLGESKTISGLTVGETYTVHERTTGTRYDAKDDQTCTLVADKDSNKVTFNNTVRTDKWLTSSMTKKNEFAYTPATPDSN